MRMVIPFARSLTQQTARKANALVGCDKNGRSRRCAPWHRRITTTGVARLAIIPFLSATQFMMDLIRGSLRIFLFVFRLIMITQQMRDTRICKRQTLYQHAQKGIAKL